MKNKKETVGPKTLSKKLQAERAALKLKYSNSILRDRALAEWDRENKYERYS